MTEKKVKAKKVKVLSKLTKLDLGIEDMIEVEPTYTVLNPYLILKERC